MASASEVALEITDIFQKILTNNLTYCALCLRTEEERKLVEPKAFMKCLAVMRLGKPVVNTICYICEAQAARAVSLFHAISFATSINRCFKDIMATKIKSRQEVSSYLQKYMRAQSGTWGQGAGLQAPGLPRGWAAARARSHLVHTEVLLVSDSMLPPSAQASAGEPGSPGPSPPPLTPLKYTHMDRISEPDLESIVIIDDEDPPSAPPLDALASASEMPPVVSMRELLRHPHPGAAALVPGEMQLLSRHKDGKNFVLHPIVSGLDGGHYVPSLSAQLLDGALVYVDPANIRYVESEPQENLLEDKIEDKKECAPAPPAAASKQAVMSGRIDWEDKIPMDVISFMDATDPNADQILQPESPGPPPPLKRRHLDRDVIDLC